MMACFAQSLVNPIASVNSQAPGKKPLAARIFVLEPDAGVLDYLCFALGDKYDLHLFSNEDALLRKLAQGVRPDLFLLAWHNSADTPPLLSAIHIRMRDVPTILLSCSAELMDMMTATRMGARDVVMKPFLGNDLQASIEEHLAAIVNDNADEAPVEVPLNENQYFVRSSARMKEIEAQAALVARADIPVLILGESGTGKEVLALYTHKKSSRSQRTFLKVNCAAMPADLIESELFGYEQGAFTGAVKAKQGKFEMCNGGTIFLDEIGEMPANLQAKLLQVLQDGTFSRLGGRASVRVDVRVIAATNINMKQAIAQKTFREDLYYRLNGFTLQLPALRERREEIPVFAHYFMRRAAARYACAALPFSSTLMRALTEFHWPGNLRELENIINRYLVLADEFEILRELGISDGHHALSSHAANIPDGIGLKRLVRNLKGEAESIAITRALGENGWNRKETASNLKISYKALLYKIKQYNLEPTETAQHQPRS